ncbi:MAG: hypothetical protein HQ553_04430 [Chloroflexi bacterium]|nr:hypothetical protein [Chloroflexota bacterium]
MRNDKTPTGRKRAVYVVTSFIEEHGRFPTIHDVEMNDRCKFNRALKKAKELYSNTIFIMVKQPGE